MSRIKVVADSHIPYLESLDGIADIVRLDPGNIDADAVRDADALLVRTRTRCDASLLAGSRVRFVGTATIGLDHVDAGWCAGAGITVANAPGCNAPAVAQYVFASLMQLANRPLRSYTLGIVGVGHVGSIIAAWAGSMGMRVMLCDPPRQRAEGGDGWSTLGDLEREADIITFHTPLAADGPDATVHLADERFFNALRRAPVVINAARGPVVDNRAWIAAIEAGVVSGSVVDCWENEPDIDRRLLALADIATPHIAGYSSDGKKRASMMVIDALCTTFGLDVPDSGLEVAPVPSSISLVEAMRSYDPLADTEILRARPEEFENLRNHYPLRNEIRGYIEH